MAWDGHRHRGGRGLDHAQRLPIEAGGQDQLHRGVAVLAHGAGSGAGRFQPGRAVPLGEAEDALGASQAIERSIAEERGDERGAGGADRRGLLLAPARRLEEEVHLIRGQVVVEGATLAGPGGEMRGHQRVGVEELDLSGRGTHPEPLADQPVGRGVVGPREHHVAVGMELGLLPGHRRPGRGRQGEERRALDGLEEDERLLLDRAVAPAPRGLHTPAERVLVRVVDVAERPARQAVAAHVVDAPLFHLPLVLRRLGPAGGDEEAVVLGQLPVDALHFGVVEHGPDDGGLQVVEHHPARDSLKPLERRAVTPAPGGDGLVEDELDVLVAAERQRQHEGPGPAEAVPVGIEHEAGRPEVHLGFLPRGRLHADRGPQGRRLQATEEALHRGVTPGEALLLDEELEDRLALHALLPPRHDLRPERGHAGLVGPGLGRLRRLEQRGQRGRVGQLAGEQAVLPRPAVVAGHRVPAQPELAGDPAGRLSEAEPAEHFAYIGHLAPPCSHGAPPGWGSRRAIPDVAAKRKGPGRRIVRVAQYQATRGGSVSGDPRWLSTADPGWLRWATLGGSVSPTPVAQYRVTADSRSIRPRMASSRLIVPLAAPAFCRRAE